MNKFSIQKARGQGSPCSERELNILGKKDQSDKAIISPVTKVPPQVMNLLGTFHISLSKGETVV